MPLSHIECLLIHAAAVLLGKIATGGIAVRISGHKRKLIVEADADDVASSATAVEPLVNPPIDPLFSQALAILFSDDEQAVVEAVAVRPESASALSRLLTGRPGDNTRVKILLSNLVDRRVLRVGDEGYEIACPAIAELLRRCRGVA